MANHLVTIVDIAKLCGLDGNPIDNRWHIQTSHLTCIRLRAYLAYVYGECYVLNTASEFIPVMPEADAAGAYTFKIGARSGTLCARLNKTIDSWASVLRLVTDPVPDCPNCHITMAPAVGWVTGIPMAHAQCMVCLSMKRSIRTL